MYSLAKQLAGRMKAIMDIESEIAEAERNQQGEEFVRDLEQKRSDLIKTFTRDELLVIKTVMNVGRSERGYRYHFNSNEIEIIHLPIELTGPELMQKYSYYLVHKTKQELANGIEYYTAVSEQLKEGMEILKL
ncbi:MULTISPECIES: hypothetical protein [Paenibacillus]|uniref:hypothetical protein n=1 Tax=Paenibacillus TaxID=44249 RepID=UPI000883D95F|nr:MULTISPECIES: hypothetical protein [Paenibacillus]WDQ34276.1 hypothetical protein PTQ21_08545 [Paenibacillus marchantiae]SDL65901.1 hypothetical protein SAMN05428961_10647 [Paenibacillus sp. OK060]SLK07688.1 hypothetical protein SAMN06272722_10555 [Paenibacillus sp. RU5A]SOC70811.1 hypothetical protein SAMN05880581_10554 [Paenibacillus sp. RU26A]SOC73190.1 hypothetical protein SAMN05880586_10555 [Paenibacillus sp. RU5M]